jgi:hypothetical protein
VKYLSVFERLGTGGDILPYTHYNSHSGKLGIKFIIMMEKIKKHFSGHNPKYFVILAVVALIILDLINSYYLRLYWVHKNLSILYVEKVASTQGLDFRQLSQESIREVKQVIDNGFFFFLFVVFANNLFFYFFYLRKKLWAQGYVLFYTVTNSLLAVLFLIEGPILGTSWFLYNIMTIFIYLYLYLGVKVLKGATTGIIPGHEMKEQ